MTILTFLVYTRPSMTGGLETVCLIITCNRRRIHAGNLAGAKMTVMASQAPVSLVTPEAGAGGGINIAGIVPIDPVGLGANHRVVYAIKGAFGAVAGVADVGFEKAEFAVFVLILWISISRLEERGIFATLKVSGSMTGGTSAFILR